MIMVSLKLPQSCVMAGPINSLKPSHVGRCHIPDVLVEGTIKQCPMAGNGSSVMFAVLLQCNGSVLRCPEAQPLPPAQPPPLPPQQRL